MTQRRTEDEVTRPIITPKPKKTETIIPESAENIIPESEENITPSKKSRKRGFKWTWVLTLGLVLCAIACLVYMSFFQKDEILSDENDIENSSLSVSSSNTAYEETDDLESPEEEELIDEEIVPDSVPDEDPEEIVEEIVEMEPVTTADDDRTYDMSEAEQNPTFPGGDGAMYSWLNSNNSLIGDDGSKGKVIVSFVVEKNGSITDVRVVRGRGAKLDAEAVRLVNAMPTWIPGRNNGQPVRVKYQLPITF